MKVAAVAVVLSFSVVSQAADPREQFETHVRPVLATSCYSCHTQAQMGGLRLDSREAILKGGKSGPSVVPGSSANSLLIQVVNHSHDRLKMPPSGKLTSEQISALAAWVDSGLYWPEAVPGQAAASSKSGEYVITPEQRAFWSFRPVTRPSSPQVSNASWAKSEVDRFILAKLDTAGLRPVRPADKRTLIRRASLDLTGLPPTPEEVDRFLDDSSADAFAKVVDRLLASPRYGERWARHWLDVARYSDDSFSSTEDVPYPNAFRYRNWVIDAFNKDLPYDVFVKAQIAGDLMKADDPQHYAPGTGFYSLSPEMQDERVDATTRGFMGITVACAQCHDHKYDPIPTKDYYSLQGVFSSTKLNETPLAPKEVVDAWQAHKKKLDKAQATLTNFYESQTQQLGEMLAAQTARYMLAAKGLGPADGLDDETLKRWSSYLQTEQKDHPFLKSWFASPSEKTAAEFQDVVLAVIEEKKEVDQKNLIILGLNPERDKLAGASLESLPRDRYVLWRDLFAKANKDSAGFFSTPDGVVHYGKGKIERFLHGTWNQHLEILKADVDRLKKSLPEQYPFLQTITDDEKPKDVKIQIRGDRNNLGEVAPRRFLAILSPEERRPFANGAGRMELAEAIADPKNPLTARVMVNRIWQHHFGRGIVNTPSNFGQLGERPTHPELLDYLASEFVSSGWSIKAVHRLIMLSATYQLAAENAEPNLTKDPDNLLVWRANRRRLDIEALRDSVLFASGRLDLSPAAKAQPLNETNEKRTIYGFISRRKLDGTLALFDFPTAVSTSEARIPTNVPPQRLFLMNSGFMERQAEAFAARLSGEPADRITTAYRILFGRKPEADELKLGIDFVGKGGTWTQYARVLLSSNEFTFVE